VKLDCNIFQLAYAAKECWEFLFQHFMQGGLRGDIVNLEVQVRATADF